jgi:hypothetical protein
MFARGLRTSLVIIGAVAGGQAMAKPPHPALPAAPVAAYTQVPGKGGIAKALYYKNEDVVKTTTTTTKTPIYTTVIVPVYTTVKTPIYNSKGQITGYTTKQVQTGTTTQQKLTGYNTVTTKSTKITPKAELYTTNGSSTTPSSVPVKFLMDVGHNPFAKALSTPQDALFSLSAVSTTAPVLSNHLFSQVFDSGTLSFTRTTPLYLMDAFGHKKSGPLTNLLTVTFTNALLTATENGLTIGFAASTPDSTINFTSDFRKFTRPDWLTNFNFAISGDASSVKLARASVDPTLTNVTGTRSLNSFRVSSTGTFAASPVPEAGSWTMMILGFAAIGFTRRADARKFARFTV